MELRHLWQGSTSPNWPNASNTGVSRGVVLTDSLRNSFNTSHNGMTFENLIFTDNVEIFGSNITLRNCRFQGFGLYGLIQYTDPPHNSVNVKVDRCEFDGGGAVHCSAIAIGGGDCAVTGCNIHDVTIGIQSLGAMTIAGNYLHDFRAETEDIDQKHFDGITVFGGGGVTIENNAIEMPDPAGGTACIFMKAQFSAIDDVTVNNNLLMGYASYTVFIEDSSHTTTGIAVRNTYLQRGIFGTIGTDTVEAPTEIGNVEWNPKSPDFDPAPSAVQAWLATV